MATIEEPLVPIYMYHRYAVESAASMIGGQDFVYAMRGDGRTPVEVGERRESAQGDRRAGGDAQAVGADDPEEDPRPDSAAAAGLRHAPRAVPAHDRRRLRSGQSRRRSPPTSRSASSCSPIARRAWWRRTRSIQSLPGLGEVIDRLTKATFDAADVAAPTKPKCAAPPSACWSIA